MDITRCHKWAEIFGVADQIDRYIFRTLMMSTTADETGEIGGELKVLAQIPRSGLPETFVLASRRPIFS